MPLQSNHLLNRQRDPASTARCEGIGGSNWGPRDLRPRWSV